VRWEGKERKDYEKRNGEGKKETRSFPRTEATTTGITINGMARDASDWIVVFCFWFEKPEVGAAALVHPRALAQRTN